MKLFSQALVTIDRSKFKAYTARDRNFTNGKIDKRQQQIEESIQRYLSTLEAFSCCRSHPPTRRCNCTRRARRAHLASQAAAWRCDFRSRAVATIDWLRR